VTIGIGGTIELQAVSVNRTIIPTRKRRKRERRTLKVGELSGRVVTWWNVMLEVGWTHDQGTAA